MTQIQYTMLGIIAEYTLDKGKGGYAATWHIADVLGVRRDEFANPMLVYGAALKDLVARGLVEEVPNLGERYRLKGVTRE